MYYNPLYNYILKYYIFWICSIMIAESKKPTDKRQQEIWRMECELGVVNDVECPVDGGWASWTSWSPCRGLCDDTGYRSRTRECINPPPSKDGIPCNGPEEHSEACYLTNCTVEDYRKLVTGDIGRTQALRQLEAAPALMERCLSMECPFEAIEAALATDNTWQLNSETLWNSLQCVKHNIGCPVAGEWGAWGVWSTCGARCGLGHRWRLRRCDTPSPSEARYLCLGSPLQADQCKGDQCANDRVFGGSWGDWGQWTSCSEECGVGVRRRRRSCLEVHTPLTSGSWGTHCKGQHDQLEECENEHCTMNGGWSGWSPWGPCSQTCGAGQQSRTRSCTRPIPSGNGYSCLGPRTETGSCYVISCQVQTHTVALFNGDSFLQYNFEDKRSTLFHFYIRFMPLSPNGILVRRGSSLGPYVRLSLQKWHICLDASGSSKICSPPRICSHSIIEPAVWHTALIAVSNEAIILRLDNAPITMRSTFTCNPDLPNDNVNIFVGEKLHGEIQELVLNFIPLKITIDKHRVKRYDFSPSAASNIAYDKASMNEAYLELEFEQYARLPCFVNQDEWRLDLTLKPKKPSGIILFLKNNEDSLLLALQNMRLKLKLGLRGVHSESFSSIDYLPNQWLDISITKKRDTNAVEAVINSKERLHVLYEQNISDKTTDQKVGKYPNKTKEFLAQSTVLKRKLSKPVHIVLCYDEYFIGGIPLEVKSNITTDLSPFCGTIATLRVNGILEDLHDLNLERHKDDTAQVSSRTASISGSYHETYWGKSNHLNLTCLHARSIRSPHKAHWLYLDTVVSENMGGKNVRAVDNGKLLRMVAAANNELRGFYTCRAYTNGRTSNIVTYGVLGKVQYKLSGPDLTTAIAVISTIALVVSTLTWLFIEGIHDLRDGHGFFRDAHLSPLEEAEAICKYIDQNINLVGSKEAAEAAKSKARRRGSSLASRSGSAFQEPRGLMEENIETNEEDDTINSEPEDVPALPENKKPSLEVAHDIFRFEPNYISSPRHGSITSPRTKLSSSSSFEFPSPRVLCSRLLMSKRLHSSKVSRKPKHLTSTCQKACFNLLTIKSSSCVNQSPGQKILQKFQQLSKDDI